jgi:DNA methylase
MQAFDGRVIVDARALPIASESVQCVVTSPPYYGLRDYKHDGQIGLEATPREYLNTIRECFAEIQRVTEECRDGLVEPRRFLCWIVGRTIEGERRQARAQRFGT